ncbi:hypothetical protein DN115_22265 [Salmonella enterica subsp. enterica]|nr:hypothetical protein [Salmonella enterica subsp. enterica serovar Chester]
MPDGGANASYPAYNEHNKTGRKCGPLALLPDGGANASYPAYNEHNKTGRKCGPLAFVGRISVSAIRLRD